MEISKTESPYTLLYCPWAYFEFLGYLNERKLESGLLVGSVILILYDVLT